MAAANENILPQFHNARKNLANGELIFNKKKPFVTRASDNYLHNKSKVGPRTEYRHRSHHNVLAVVTA